MPHHKDSDSSSSSDSDSSRGHGKKHKDKKDKKDKKNKKDKKDKQGTSGKRFDPDEYRGEGSRGPLQMPVFPESNVMIPQQPPPAYAPTQPAPPISGYRLPLTTSGAFPSHQQAGPPPTIDADGVSPVFFGSALMGRSIHPCKIGQHLVPYAQVPYGGVETGHHGRYDLLPFVPEQMELVPTSHGRIPPGRRPVDGGYEEDGAKLYHAVAVVHETRVPGKAGAHLGGANVSFGGSECNIQDNYELLCWR